MTQITIVRGLIGSGKTTLANRIAGVNHNFHIDDFYAAEPSEYRVGSLPFGSNILQTYERIRKVAIGKPNHIVIDGCFSKLEHVANLLQKLHDLSHLDFSVVTPNTRWARDPFECCNRSQHQVPLGVIVRQANNFEAFGTDEVKDLWTDMWLGQFSLA